MNDYEDYILGGAGYIPYLKETINPITQRHTSTDYVDEECNRLVEEQGYISIGLTIRLCYNTSTL